MTKASSVVSSDSWCIVSATRGHNGVFQREETQSEYEINDSSPDGEDNEPGVHSGFPNDRMMGLKQEFRRCLHPAKYALNGLF